MKIKAKLENLSDITELEMGYNYYIVSMDRVTGQIVMETGISPTTIIATTDGDYVLSPKK